MLNAHHLVILAIALVGCYCVDLEPANCKFGRNQNVPKPIYSQLKCNPIFGADNCIERYDCPHTNRPKDTCYFKGKTLQIEDLIDSAELSDVWAAGCECSKSLEFNCPELTDGCAEDWVGGYPSPGCYLRRELNSYCAAGEICPPFEGNAECKVDKKVYKEGEHFQHPTDDCSQCVCNKGFDGKFEAPFCQPTNCTDSMLKNNKKIDEFCAPIYQEDKCCPDSWICPTENDEHKPNPVGSSGADQPCTFGNKKMAIGDYFTQKHARYGDITCECLLPPYVYCAVYKNEATILN